MKASDLALMYVSDDRIESDRVFFDIMEKALRGGASMIQLREKGSSTLRFYERAKESKRLCSLYAIPLIINDRVDIALAVDADGVHVGQSDMPPAITRKLIGKNKIIGLSVGTLEQAANANFLDVDYIGVSPIFSSNTKTEGLERPLGIEGLTAIKKTSAKPIICIGGIHTGNAAEVFKHGSDGIAVISAISAAPDPEQVTNQLKSIACQHGIIK